MTSRDIDPGLPLFGIYGAGGCGRSVLPVADEMLRSRLGNDAFSLVFVDDTAEQSTINRHPVLSYAEFRTVPVTDRRLAIAVADPRVRRDLADRCEADGISFFSVRAANSVVMAPVEMGAGSIISPFVTLTVNIRIGRHFHGNLYSYVEHDCIIGDFVTFGPAVRCNGNVLIEDGAYLGAGCIIRQGSHGEPLVIGSGAVVGMGAVVTKDVPAGVTVAGNPARPLAQSR